MALDFVKKIRVLDADHSKRIQDALFDEGYTWSSTGRRDYKFTEEPCLFAEDSTDGDKYILFGGDGPFFDECKAQEYFLTKDGKLVTECQSALTVRPAEEVKALHKAIDVERLKELSAYLMHAVENGIQVTHQEHMEYNGLLLNLLSYK